MNSQVRRVLFIRTDRIGDLLMNLPAIRLLRQTYPKAWISILMDASVAELLEGHPDIDEVITVSASEFKRNFIYRARLVQKIRKIGFDLGIVSNPDKFLHALLFFSKIPRRVGYDRKWSFFLNRKMSSERDDGSQHEIQKNLELIKLVSPESWDGSIHLPVDERHRLSIEELMRKADLIGKHFVVVHPGTSNPEKRWPEDCFAQVCDRIQSDLNLRTILIGGKEEIENSNKVVGQVRVPLVDWTGRLGLRQLVALFRRPEAKALISSDSGPVHIAWISGTPVVAMYAQNMVGSDPGKWGPRDVLSEAIFKPMNEISVEEVYGRVKKILKK